MVTRLFHIPIFNIMKRVLILTAILFTTINIFAQDIITKRNGEEIKAKVLTINNKEINYIKWSNQNGPTYTILKSDVFMIKYENGEREIFDVPITKPEQKIQINSNFTQQQMTQNNIDFLKREDLLKRSRLYKGWGWGLSAVIFIGGTVGGILAGIGDWSTGASIGYGCGIGVLTVIPMATLVVKGNKLENEAYAIKVASLPIHTHQIGNISIEPNVALMSCQITKSPSVGIGAKISF